VSDFKTITTTIIITITTIIIFTNLLEDGKIVSKVKQFLPDGFSGIT